MFVTVRNTRDDYDDNRKSTYVYFFFVSSSSWLLVNILLAKPYFRDFHNEIWVRWLRMLFYEELWSKDIFLILWFNPHAIFRALSCEIETAGNMLLSGNWHYPLDPTWPVSLVTCALRGEQWKDCMSEISRKLIMSSIMMGVRWYLNVNWDQVGVKASSVDIRVNLNSFVNRHYACQETVCRSFRWQQVCDQWWQILLAVWVSEWVSRVYAVF